MPASQWVAFEGDNPHKCDNPPIKNKKPTKPPAMVAGTTSGNANEGGLAKFGDRSKTIGTDQPAQRAPFPNARPSENSNASSEKSVSAAKFNWSWILWLIFISAILRLLTHLGGTHTH
jgi:hypothetical protein